MEVKAIGKISEAADDQLCDYAFKAGVPIAILTDGQEWLFYYPAGKGSIPERRFYKIDILEREPDEIQAQMELFLKYDNVHNGTSAKNAKDAYENSRARILSKTYIPKAFQKLVDDNDEKLIDLISEKVADLCGVKPSVDDIARYLKSSTFSQTSSDDRNSNKQSVANPIVNQPVTSNGRTGFYLNGYFTPKNTAIDVIINLFKKLDEVYPGFLQKFEQDDCNYGRKNKYISRNRNELYPDDPIRTQDSTVELSDGYWMGTNISNQIKKRHALNAASVLGLKYDKDIFIKID
jgi:hypothetical protein